MQWTTTKPSEPCVFVAAQYYLNRNVWDHEIYELKWIDTGDGLYLCILTGDGDEWGALEDLTADKYCILPKHK